MANTDRQLMSLVKAVLEGNIEKCAELVKASPVLATARFQLGATRTTAEPHFLASIGRYVYAGDTALHMASAAYEQKISDLLIEAGADVHATNRCGYNPLHAAAAGGPNSMRWNPARQSATIRTLVKAGADPNSTDKRGVTPLHIAVRTRCSMAVQALIECGANPEQRNKSGSDAMVLALYTTGRPGSGSPEAKREQQQIVQLLRLAGLSSADSARLH